VTVYVDNARIPAPIGRLRGTFSHMFADSKEELHAFAERIGLKREWFQDPVVYGKPPAKPGSRAAENWHYDVTESMRKRAIALGAVAIEWRQMPELIKHRVLHGRCRPDAPEGGQGGLF
jgi:hypothetical protein